ERAGRDRGLLRPRAGGASRALECVAAGGKTGQRAAGGVDVRASRVAADEADPVLGEGGEEPAALGVVRRLESARGIVHVDCGEAHLEAREEPSQLARL